MLERFFPRFGRRARRLSADELAAIATVAEQVVLCVEQTMRMSGPEKKALALRVAIELLRESGLEAPVRMVDTAIEAAVRVMRLFEDTARAS